MPVTLHLIVLLVLSLVPQSALKTEYDKFRDETTVETGRHGVDKKRSDRGELEVAAYFNHKGKTRTADNLIIGLTFYSEARRWRFTRDDHLIVIADGERIDLGESAAKDSRVSRSARTREILDYALTPKQLQQLAGAAKIEAQLGSVEFKLKDKFLNELRQLALSAKQ